MKSVTFDQVWWTLRQEEHEAAMQGGAPWSDFVAKCERQLDLPWNRIRDTFEMIPMVSDHQLPSSSRRGLRW